MPSLQEAVTEVRRLLQDESLLPQRHSDAAIVSNIAQAIMTAERLRPDFKVGRAPRSGWAVDVNDLGALLPAWTQDYFPSLVEFAAAKTELKEDQYSEDGRTGALIARFERALTGIGS